MIPRQVASNMILPSGKAKLMLRRAVSGSGLPFLFLLVGLCGVSLSLAPVASGQETEAPIAASAGASGSSLSEETVSEAPAEPSADAQFTYSINNMLLLVCAVLVLFMQAGFSLVEVGLNAAKNTVNILFKNLMDMSLGVLVFFAIGYGLMYHGETIAGGWLRIPELFVSMEPSVLEDGELSPGLHPQADFLFQVAFAATAATIVSGAVAGRMKFNAYLIYTVILTAFVYPISGMWKWGGGPINEWGFHDFAGSIVVHAVGGFAALAGAMVLGPRIGRFVNGKSIPMPGHNLTFAALGVFILFVGWFGFNCGSQLAFASQGDIDVVMLVAVNTVLAAGAGAAVAMFLAWGLFKKPDLTMALNGVLAGLVGITANCDCVDNFEALIIGGIAGVIVVAAIVALDKLRIDDPVGAFPVHGACGIWGGIATGIFGVDKSLTVQLLGTLIICSWAFFVMLGVFGVMRLLGILRVSPEEEIEGLDTGEHGMHAYPPEMIGGVQPLSGSLIGSPAPGVQVEPAASV